LKIAIIGAGRVGATAAFTLAERSLCSEIALIDIYGDLARGEALDIAQGNAARGRESHIFGSEDYSSLSGSELVIITAGVPRKQGDTRLDLLKKNEAIMRKIVSSIKRFNSDCMVLVVSNPVDVMTYLVLREFGSRDKRVFGLGTLLDTIRFRSAISAKYGVPSSKVEVSVVGEHGDSMLPLLSSGKIAGGSALEFEGIEKLFERVRDGGGEVIRLKGATFFAPALAIAKCVEAIAKDRNEVMPLSCYLAEHDICIGHLTKVGRSGVRPAKMPMSAAEDKLFLKSIGVIKGEVNKLGLK